MCAVGGCAVEAVKSNRVDEEVRSVNPRKEMQSFGGAMPGEELRLRSHGLAMVPRDRVPTLEQTNSEGVVDAWRFYPGLSGTIVVRPKSKGRGIQSNRTSRCK